MDGFYRGIEASLLVLSLALGLAALATTVPVDPKSAIQVAVVLPMLSVMADRSDAR